MTVRQRRYSKEEIAQRGQELYEGGIRQQVETGIVLCTISGREA